ncbi:hypothetical protein, partial [Cytobacillus oceanisediminis]|uniref:hypothetical protein n=1 Tax=Cytobacillus oceanisediminis TaxID=665099 RepID=UPI001C92D4EE
PTSSLTQQEWIKAQNPNPNILTSILTHKKHNNTIPTTILSTIHYKNPTAEIHINLITHATPRACAPDTITTLLKYPLHQFTLRSLYPHVNAYNIPSQ